MAITFAFVIGTIGLAFTHNPPYKGDSWFDFNGDPEICHLETQYDLMTVGGEKDQNVAVEAAVELARAEYNREVNGLTIASEDTGCGWNAIEVGAKGLDWWVMAKTLVVVTWFNGDCAETEVDFATGYDWEINSNICDWTGDKDVEWIANHEIGHALGMGHHSNGDTVMSGGCNNDWQNVDSETENALEQRY